MKKKNLYLLLIPAILACAAVILVSLYIAFRPFTLEDIQRLAGNVCTFAEERFDSIKNTVASWKADSVPAASEMISDSDADTGTSSAPYIESTGEQGDVSSLQEDSGDTSEEIYLYMLDTNCGPMLYYHQGDLRWGDSLYGGYDPMSKYGCGPTALSMVINSFTDSAVDPTDIADWAAENGYYALNGGSYHSLIPDALTAYGLTVESVTDRSYEHVSDLLSSGHILVALMGRGTLTAGGHFVLFTSLLEDGKISIADPASYENCTLEWDLKQLLNELKKSYDSGGPLWAVKP